MVIELDEIVKLLGFAIAIPLTVCGIICCCLSHGKSGSVHHLFSWQSEQCREQDCGR